MTAELDPGARGFVGYMLRLTPDKRQRVLDCMNEKIEKERATSEGGEPFSSECSREWLCMMFGPAFTHAIAEATIDNRVLLLRMRGYAWTRQAMEMERELLHYVNVRIDPEVALKRVAWLSPTDVS